MSATTPLFRRHHIIAIIPAVALLASPFVANRVEPRVLGMPFLLGWIVMWVLATSLVMGIVLYLDRND